MKETQTFPASLQVLDAMKQFINQRAQSCPFDDSNLLHIELACEEALVNIIKYAYPKGDGCITILIEADDHLFKTCIIDQGIPYNPLEKKTKGWIANKKITHGGYGIFLFSELMDDVQYQYCNGNNQLLLVKRIE